MVHHLLSLLVVSCLCLWGCGGSDQQQGCNDCPQGCCLNGSCVPPQHLSNEACGAGGGECRSCTALAMTCDLASGQCISLTDDPLVAVQSCDPPCDPLTQICVGGVCQVATTRPGCNPACDPLTHSCVNGSCQPNVTQGCVGCLSPNVCHEGRCLDRAAFCRETCAGCCGSDGTCLALGAGGGQSADHCGREGHQCQSCRSAGTDCDVARGVCGGVSSGVVRICLHSATVDGTYEDADCGFGVKPEVIVRFEVGGKVLATTPFGSIALEDGDGAKVWNVGWGGQCVDVTVAEAYETGIDIHALDRDSGPFCGGDDHLGTCKTNPSAWGLNFGHKFALDGERCEGKLQQLWIEVLPQ